MLVTTSRADYGIQSRLARMLQDDPEVDFFLVVSGTHLSARHGMTIREIEGDGLRIAARVDVGVDSEPDVPHVMARAVVEFSCVIRELRPDVCILLGDRFEMMSAALACTLCRVPIAHLHGGETTVGAIDEVFRHSITKAAWLHFTACEEYRRRVIQMGESPDRVFNVGALGVENIRNAVLMSRDELSARVRLPLQGRLFVVTYHPETSGGQVPPGALDGLFAALDGFPGASLLFTRPNADSGGDALAARISAYVESRPNAVMVGSLGMTAYLSAVREADAVVGNSSSGIIEAPSLHTPTVNIGDRQKGRVRAESVIDCRPDRAEIVRALGKALEMKDSGRPGLFDNPYWSEGTAGRMLSLLKSESLEGALRKSFFDIGGVVP